MFKRERVEAVNDVRLRSFTVRIERFRGDEVRRSGSVSVVGSVLVRVERLGGRVGYRAVGVYAPDNHTGEQINVQDTERYEDLK